MVFDLSCMVIGCQPNIGLRIFNLIYLSTQKKWEVYEVSWWFENRKQWGVIN